MKLTEGRANFCYVFYLVKPEIIYKKVIGKSYGNHKAL